MQTCLAQMHPATLAAIVIELIMLGAQLILVMNRPDERTRLWYLVLLIMLMACNLSRGLFPDPDYPIPVHIQHITNYGFGFLTASYFPFYFYKAFGLVPLRFHALYGAPLFLLLPYMIFFWVIYPVDKDLEAAIRHVVVIPFLYALVLLWAILRAIRLSYREHRDKHFYSEEIMVYWAVVLWAAVALALYFRLGQFTETLFTNIGFLVTTVLLLIRAIRHEREENELLRELRLVPNDPVKVSVNSTRCGLTTKESEVVQLICLRLKYREIADKLFISPRTVDKHRENIFHKVKVATREELIKKMNQP